MATNGEDETIDVPEKKQQDVSKARIAGLAKARAIKAAKAEAKRLRESGMANRRSWSRNTRAWSSEEEQALLTALETPGPFWALIEKSHGAKGTIDQSLKKRSANQLLHKASRIKAQMIKKGKRIPAYMDEITARKLKRSYSVGSEDEGEEDDEDEDDEEIVLPVSKRARRSGLAKEEDQAINGTTELDEDESGFAGNEHVSTLPHTTPTSLQTQHQPDKSIRRADVDEDRRTTAGFGESERPSTSINQQTESDVDGEDELMMEMQLHTARAKRVEAELEFPLALMRRNCGRR